MADLTHVDSTGAARMVDVSEKDVSKRVATATGRLRTTPEVVKALRENSLAKGDALATARIAGIMAAKRTPDLVPLCHPIAISGVKVELEVTDDGVDIAARVKTADRTGVEMEALTAVSVAALTLVDMVKALDPAAQITDIQVEEKLGGKTGTWQREAPAGKRSERPGGARRAAEGRDEEPAKPEPKARRHADASEPDLSDTVIISRPKTNGEDSR